MDDKTGEQLFAQFQEASNLMRRYLYQVKKQRGEADFQQGQGRLMRLLAQQEGLSQKELAAQMKIRPASLSELLAKLQAKGYLLRSQNPRDKRVYSYSLTDEGRQAAQRLEQVKQQYGRKVFSVLDEEEAAGLSSALDKLARSLEQRLD